MDFKASVKVFAQNVEPYGCGKRGHHQHQNGCWLSMPLLAILVTWISIVNVSIDAYPRYANTMLSLKQEERKTPELASVLSPFPPTHSSVLSAPKNGENGVNDNQEPISLESMDSNQQSDQSSYNSSPQHDTLGQKETEQIMNPDEVLSANTNGSPKDLEQPDMVEAVRDQINYWEEPLMEKRNQWGKFNGAWGKRLGNWNKLQSAWGKKRAGPIIARSWNNLSGAWGRKRAKWSELNGMWGKRSPTWNKMSSAWGKKKRSATQPHWNNLRGMWGKKRGTSLETGPNHTSGTTTTANFNLKPSDVASN